MTKKITALGAAAVAVIGLSTSVSAGTLETVTRRAGVGPFSPVLSERATLMDDSDFILTGHIWYDNDENGFHETNEPWICDYIDITATSKTTGLSYTGSLKLDGSGKFEIVVPDSYDEYEVEITQSPHYIVSTTEKPIKVSITAETVTKTIDVGSFGVTMKPQADARLWLDVNKNGDWDEGEAPLSGVAVTLFPNDNPADKTTVLTNSEGIANFGNRDVGTYTMTVKTPQLNGKDLISTSFGSSFDGVVLDIFTDSDGVLKIQDAAVFFGYAEQDAAKPTDVPTLKPSATPTVNPTTEPTKAPSSDPRPTIIPTETPKPTEDPSFIPPVATIVPEDMRGTVTGTVWIDDTPNNIIDSEERRLEGITVTLHYFTGGESVTTTNENGEYEFTSVPPGEHYITISDDGVEGLEDYSVINGGAFVVKSGETTIKNYGYYRSVIHIPESGTVTGTVWNDMNDNGKMDADEAVIKNVTVVLSNGDYSYITKTLEDAKYTFDSIPGGEYTINAVSSSLTNYHITTTTEVKVDGDVEKNIGFKENTPEPTAKPNNTVKISGYVWNDTDSNRSYDKDEKPFEGEVYITFTYVKELPAEEPTSTPEASTEQNKENTPAPTTEPSATPTAEPTTAPTEEPAVYVVNVKDGYYEINLPKAVYNVKVTLPEIGTKKLYLCTTKNNNVDFELEYRTDYDIGFKITNKSSGSSDYRPSTPRPTATPKPTATPVPGLNKTEHFAYIVGYPDGNVRPEAKISRAEVSTIFFRLLTDESRSQYWSKSNDYSDILNNAWYNNAVSTLSNAGIVNGYSSGEFRPDNCITRAEFAAIAARFNNSTYSGEDKFSDISGHWAADYINRAAARGWIKGYEDGTFKPDQEITRAEAIMLVNNVLDRKVEIGNMIDGMTVWNDNDPKAWYYTAVQEATNSHTYTNNGSEKWSELEKAKDWASLEKTWSKN